MITELNFIPNINQYRFISEISAGYSGDKKYKLEKGGNYYLLRIGDKASADIKRKEFGHLKLFRNTDINIHYPVDFGIVGEKFYSIVTWVEGVPVMDFIKSDLSEDYYELGKKTGVELKKVHNVSSVSVPINWQCFIKEKTKQLVESCKEIDFGEIKHTAEKYIFDNLDLIKARPSVILHGDYHWENCVINENGEIGIIDFSGDITGDPWYEFGGMMWVLEYSDSFANGQLDGYFGVVPKEFWGIFKLYTALYALEHLSYNNGNDIAERVSNAKRMLLIFGENFSNDIPLFRK